MATQDALNKSLCHLCAFSEINGIMELVKLGADPKADNCSALLIAITCDNLMIANLLIHMRHYDDPYIQYDFRKLGIICQNEEIRKVLIDHNEYAIKNLGWNDGTVVDYYKI